MLSPVASPALKNVGPHNFCLRVNSKKSQYAYAVHPPLYKNNFKTIQWFALISIEGLHVIVGIGTHPFPPWRRHWFSPKFPMSLAPVYRLAGYIYTRRRWFSVGSNACSFLLICHPTADAGYPLFRKPLLKYSESSQSAGDRRPRSAIRRFAVYSLAGAQRACPGIFRDGFYRASPLLLWRLVCWHRWLQRFVLSIAR